MGRRWFSLTLGFVLIVSTVVGLGLPAVALAATTYNSCPSFATFKSDAEAVTGPGIITFNAVKCVLTADSSITTQAGSDVTINGNGLTLTGGTSTSPGGFILIDMGDDANLTLDHVTLSYGSDGIRQVGNGAISVVGSTISGHRDYGILQNGPSGTVTVTGSTISDNGVVGIGHGGVRVSVTDSTVSGNTSYGILQIGPSGETVVTNSTVSDNGASGIYESGTSGSVKSISSTISGNGQYGILLSDASSSATLRATLLAHNSAGNCQFAGSHTDFGYNLSTDATCGFSSTGSQNSVTDSLLNLGTLSDNGGPTETVPLLPNSIAIDAIPLVLGNCAAGPNVDQRGVSRPQGNGCDIGAFEATISTGGSSLFMTGNLQHALFAFLFSSRPTARPIGILTYRDAAISLSRVRPVSLIVSDSQATIIGSGQLANGATVVFQIDVRTSPLQTFRLRVSNGYDTGIQAATVVRIHPSS